MLYTGTVVLIVVTLLMVNMRPVNATEAICVTVTATSHLTNVTLSTWQAQADVALSVAMTTVSTLLAVAATPLLTKLLVGQLVPVSVGALLLSTLQVRSNPLLTECLSNMCA